MTGLVFTKYDKNIDKAMRLLRHHVPTDTCKIIWVLNIIEEKPHIEEVRELETKHKIKIQEHEIEIEGGLTRTRNLNTIQAKIYAKNKYEMIKFCIGDHYHDSLEAIKLALDDIANSKAYKASELLEVVV